jgi:glutathione S-transferase
VSAKLYAVPISHPCMSAQLMLEHKGIDYQRIDLMAGLHGLTLRARGFQRDYTPALAVDGERFQGTREISRALDRMRPDPPLFPAEPDARSRVETAERFGEEVLQMLARRIGITVARHSRAGFDFSYGPKVSRRAAMALRVPGAGGFLVFRYGAKDAVAQADLIALPSILRTIDEWIEEGVLGGEQLNAADFQVATSLQLLLSFADLAPMLEDRPATALARRVAPPYPLQVGPVLPPHWLEQMRSGVQAGPGAKLKA